jgi:hypothetical protein
MEVWFIALCGISQQCKLGYAEDIAINIFYAGFPHFFCFGVGEDSKVEASKTNGDDKLLNLV